MQWLGELVWVERMLAFEVLPSLVASVGDEELKGALDHHLRETRAQALRAEQAFRALGIEPSSNRSAPLEALAKQHDQLAGSIVEPRLRDAFHAAAAAATERYELALYAAAIELGDALGTGEATGLLRTSRDEEEHALETADRARRRLLEASLG